MAAAKNLAGPDPGGTGNSVRRATSSSSWSRSPRPGRRTRSATPPPAPAAFSSPQPSICAHNPGLFDTAEARHHFNHELVTKTGVGGTDHIWFYDVQADGYSLDDKRTPLLPKDKLGVSPTALPSQPLALPSQPLGFPFRGAAEESASPTAPLTARHPERSAAQSKDPEGHSASPTDPNPSTSTFAAADHARNNLPDIATRYPHRAITAPSPSHHRAITERQNPRTAQSFTVPAKSFTVPAKSFTVPAKRSPPATPGVDIANFRAKAQHFLARHEQKPCIQHLRWNEPVTTDDLAALEAIFLAEGSSPAELAALTGEQPRLGLFVRSLVGLDRSAARQALHAFLDGKTLAASQYEFIELVVELLTRRGYVDPPQLFDPPFTDAHPEGLTGVFSAPEISQLLKVLTTVKENASGRISA